MLLVSFLRLILPGLLGNQAALLARALAAEQQLEVVLRSAKRPKLRKRDRIFWVLLKRLWPSGWKQSLVIVQPDTVYRWHRHGYRLFWRWKSRPTGRPKITAEVRELIREMSLANPTWGAPRIQAELKLLGYRVAKSTIEKYRVKSTGPPSPGGWKAFLANHAPDLAACDFFTVPTATFQRLYAFVILSHDRRRVIHFNVTTNPTARWTAQQLSEAFPYDTAPKKLLRDNDPLYGRVFKQRLTALDIQDVTTTPGSPWQNGHVERLVGTIRRECLDHHVVLNEQHLRRILSEFFTYYNESRPHQSLDGDSPHGRETEPPDKGDVVAIPVLNGLHHRYTRRAA